MSISPNMADCRLLEDTPVATFRALIREIHSQDRASLRQVSRSICNRTTEHIPHLCLRLCQSSSIDQLQQWRQATRQMHHAQGVLVLIQHGVPAVVFDGAMKMLSECMNISQLYLWAINSGSSTRNGKAHVPTLLPIKHLLGYLNRLSIEGIWFVDLADDLKQLASEAALVAWPLKALTLEADWKASNHCDWQDRGLVHWPVCAAAFDDVTKAFPELRELFITIPRLDYFLGSSFAKPNDFRVMQDDGSVTVVDPDIAMQVAAVAVVAALANAVLRLHNIVVLAVSRVPDIWCVWKREGQNSHTMTSSSSATATTAMIPACIAAFADVALAGESLSSAKAAAAEFITLDDCGCWLLQQHPTLACLRMKTSGDVGRTDMTCNKHQQQLGAGDSSRGTECGSCKPAAAVLPELVDLKLYYAADLLSLSAQPHSVDSDSSSSSSSSSGPKLADFSPLFDNLRHRLSPFSCCPTSKLLTTVSTLQLRLNAKDVVGVHDLLSNLGSLKHLEIYFTDAGSPVQNNLKLAAAASAAAVTGLQSLVLRADQGQHVLPLDLLLPLTTAAGSSLTSLDLSGTFAAGAVAAGSRALPGGSATVASACSALADLCLQVDAAEVVSANAATALSRQCQSCPPLDSLQQQLAAAVVPAQVAWHHALRHLTRLLELTITHNGMHRLYLPVRSLPTKLQSLTCSGLILGSSAAADTAVNDGVVGNTSSRLVACSTSVVSASHQPCGAVDNQSACPRLLQLQLTDCNIEDLSSIASQQLQQLTIVENSWPGEWAAATSAWPNVTKLVWRCSILDLEKPLEAWSRNETTIETSRRSSSHNDTSTQGMDSSVDASEPVYKQMPMTHTQDSAFSHRIEDNMFNELKTINSAFKTLRSLKIINLACTLTVDNLQLLVPCLTRLQYLQLYQGYALNSRDECWVLQKWLQQQLPWAAVSIKTRSLL